MFQRGGAIRAYGIKLICSGNEFYENTADQAGAIHLWANDNSVIDHNLFVGNSSTGNCGAVTFNECNGAEFFNNTLSENSDTGDRNAAGLVIWTSSNINIYNNIVVNNIGKGLYGYESTDCPATYNDVWENTVNYDGISPGIGSISADPLFVGGNPFSYHLLVGSPCIDTGDPESPLDPDGTRADMGAFYFDHEVTGCHYVVGDINGNGTANGLDVTYGVAFFKGGPPPPVACDMCPEPAPFYAGGDVNGSCSFNGLDITYMVAYFKGGPLLQFCPDCPAMGR